jgi:hypothetical protein
MFVAWVVFPAVLALLCLGWGCLLARVSRLRLPGVLLLPAGLASIIVVAQFATLLDATAELTTPVVVAGALAGLAVSFRYRPRDIDGWALAAFVVVFASFAAPVVLSGEATFAGYIKLDDTATWLAMTDRVMDHGRSLGGLAPSSYEATLANYLDTGYPVGSFLPWGVGQKLVGTDLAWVFQPYLAFLAAMLGLCLYSLATSLVEARPLRWLAATIASQPALVYGYSLWGGVKELAAAWVLALVAALAVPVLASDDPRAVVPLAVAGAATLGVLSIGGAVWLAPGLLLALVLLYRARGRLVAGRQAAAFVLLGAALALPALLSAQIFLRGGATTLSSGTELGNLAEPLSFLQLFGIWPAGDFRFDPEHLGVTRLLILILLFAVVLGAVAAWSRRSWGLLVYLWTAVAGCVAVLLFGSPWVDAKALATASPALVLVGLVGALGLFARGRRIEATLIALAIAGGVLWSNVLAYSEVNLAPRDRLAELESIGKEIGGEGPTLMTEYEPFGVRHFLRDGDPEGASELRRRTIPLSNGQSLPKLGYADVDQFQTDALLVYRTLVLRRSPAASRPPSPYALVKSGRYYDVWQRPQAMKTRIVTRLPLGDRFQPGAVPDCAEIRRLAGSLDAQGRLAAAPAGHPIVRELSRLVHTPDWRPDPSDGAVLYPSGDGSVKAVVDIGQAGRYGLWLGGSYRGELTLDVDGRHVTSRHHQLTHAGPLGPFASMTLSPGTHELVLHYEEGGLRPGSSGEPFALGPLALAPPLAAERVVHVPAGRVRRLCDRRWDWVEALE